jgi:hypothetical protein
MMAVRARFPLMLAALALGAVAPGTASAHSGPPFPIVSDRAAGPYLLSVWTDPDATEDGTAAGKFWILVRSLKGADASPVRVAFSARPLDRHPARTVEAASASTPSKPGEAFVTVPLDHEGPWEVHASVEGPLGRADVTAPVDATFDMRPSPVATAVVMLPFLAVGGLWLTVMIRRRSRMAAMERDAASSAAHRHE